MGSLSFQLVVVPSSLILFIGLLHKKRSIIRLVNKAHYKFLKISEFAPDVMRDGVFKSTGTQLFFAERRRRLGFVFRFFSDLPR